MYQNQLKRRTAGLVAAVAVVSFGSLGTGSAQANHASEVSATAPLPEVGGQFQVCVGVAGREVGSCDNTPIIEQGSLTLKVTGSSTHSAINTDTSPAECGGRTGVKLSKTDEAFQLLVGGRVEGTGVGGQSVAQDVGPVVSPATEGNAAYAWACLIKPPVDPPVVPSPPPTQPEPGPSPPPTQPEPGPSPPPTQPEPGPSPPPTQPEPGPSPPPTQPEPGPTAQSGAGQQPASTGSTSSEPQAHRAPLRSKLSLRPQRLRSVLSRGYGFVLSCSDGCSIDSRLSVAGRDAKQLGFATSSVVVGRARDSLSSAGRRRVVIRLSRSARLRLRNARSVRIDLRVLVSDTAGNRSVMTRSGRLGA